MCQFYENPEVIEEHFQGLMVGYGEGLTLKDIKRYIKENRTPWIKNINELTEGDKLLFKHLKTVENAFFGPTHINRPPRNKFLG